MITRVMTPTGPWFTVDRWVTDVDFKISVDGPTFNAQKGSYAKFIGRVAITPRQSLIDELLVSVSSVEEFVELFKTTSLAYPSVRIGSKTASYEKVIESLVYTRAVAVSANLKNVRKESTRRERMAKAENECARVIRRDGERVIAVVDEFLKLFNEGIVRFTTKWNRIVGERLSQALRSDKEWRDHADANGSHGDLLSEIASIESDISEIERQLSDKYDDLKVKRIRSWRDLWESDDWNWSNEGSTQPLPEAYRDAMIAALDAGEAFDALPRHRKALYMSE